MQMWAAVPVPMWAAVPVPMWAAVPVQRWAAVLVPMWAAVPVQMRAASEPHLSADMAYRHKRRVVEASVAARAHVNAIDGPAGP